MNRRFLLRIAGAGEVKPYGNTGELFTIEYSPYTFNKDKGATDSAGKYFAISDFTESDFNGLYAYKVDFSRRDTEGNIVKNTTTLDYSKVTDIIPDSKTFNIGLHNDSIVSSDGHLHILDVYNKLKANALSLDSIENYYIDESAIAIITNSITDDVIGLVSRDSVASIFPITTDGKYGFIVSNVLNLIPNSDKKQFYIGAFCNITSTNWTANIGGNNIFLKPLIMDHVFYNDFCINQEIDANTIKRINNSFCIVPIYNDNIKFPFDLEAKFSENKTLQNIVDENSLTAPFLLAEGEEHMISENFFDYYTSSSFDMSGPDIQVLFSTGVNEDSIYLLFVGCGFSDGVIDDNILQKTRIVITCPDNDNIWYSGSKTEYEGSSTDVVIQDLDISELIFNHTSEVGLLIKISSNDNETLKSMFESFDALIIDVITVDDVDTPTILYNVCRIEQIQQIEQVTDNEGNNFVYPEDVMVKFTQYNGQPFFE